MFPTTTDFQFWQSRQPRPLWARQLVIKDPFMSDVDGCINAHVNAPRLHDTTVHNLIALCRRHVGRGTLVPFLQSLSPASGPLGPKRYKLAQRWLRRIDRDAAKTHGRALAQQV